MEVFVLDEDERSTILQIAVPPPADFATLVRLFLREVDNSKLEGGALSRCPEDFIRGLLEELGDLAELWGQHD